MAELVIYHGNCIDGFTAAWAARRAFPDARFHAAHYGEPFPWNLARAASEVVIVDFSYPRDVLVEAEQALIGVSAFPLRVYDHHKTAEEALAGLPFAKFDMNRSGAGLTWDKLVGGPRPWLVDYVEDRDLWRFRLPESRAINAYIGTVDFDFALYDDLAGLAYAEVLERGSGALAYLECYVREVIGAGKLRVRLRSPLGDVWSDVPCANVPYKGCSEIGNALAKGEPFSVTWRQVVDGRFAYSLRSEGEVDVSAIAQRFGGGGHKHSSGFLSPHLAHEAIT